MEVAAELAGLVVAVLVVTAVAGRLNWSAPLCLIVVGVGASFVPGMPEYELHPEVVLLGLLPPLLYATAIRSSLVDFRANRGPIALLSVGLVVFTAVGVGVLAWLIVPGLPLAAGIALGAVVAPPDAVAATAVARRVGMPRKIVRLLEGESLFNDAAALVALRTAIAAIGGAVTVLETAENFLLAAVGGLAVGLVVGFGAALLRARMEDPVIDTAFSFVLPFLAYLPAELIHGSGVLAVVTAGLIVGHRTPTMLSGPSRLASRLNWQTIQFLLENMVFLLIGLQLRRILAEVGDSELSAGTLVLICSAVLTATIALRFVWMFAIGLLRRVTGSHAWPWRYSTVIAWAGMRGVVTLAAAFALPTDTPHRAVLVLAAFVVVAGTLLLQGTTLPLLVRRLRLPAPDPNVDALQEAALLDDMTRAGVARLDEVRRPGDPEEVLRRLRDRVRYRSDDAWEQLGRRGGTVETPSEAYRRLRLEMLEAERAEFLAARADRRVDDAVLRRILDRLDIEESMLDSVSGDADETGRELTTPPATVRSCEHLEREFAEVEPSSPDSCLECVAEGGSWVHLRLCLGCGQVACCDSSPARHATRHFETTGHPVMRSFEPGESWRWCFVDRRLG
ncbi:Na+/H+ antiporter [Prauserella sp. PE36]|uniref:Na+/H+ antiporter n=1 Tax=Prauserella sp. PE36 TaxID=1504709 RepID=UPI000D840AA3|nr:Na+/H+ antiporter [Prauserella sp. PE36]PXY30234.1 Na+/H+ antiporter [Prauserella coralliicola]RBM22692.1 Na+/H+ antiporter [Prauserella sp. PE36]